eukprot:jgi/Botrbrau1/1654/Bobra.0185s0064.1
MRWLRLFQCWRPPGPKSELAAVEVHQPLISYLPEDVWLLIFHNLNLRSIASAEQTCRHFRDMVRSNESFLFKSAYNQDDTRPGFKQAAQVLDTYVARSVVDWRRACMFRVGLVAVCEYARRKEEVAVLKVFAEACSQTLITDKEELKSLRRKAKEHEACRLRWQRRSEKELEEVERAARDGCLRSIANKEESIRLWATLLPEFSERIRTTQRQEAAACKRLMRICDGYPPKMRVHTPRNSAHSSLVHTLLRRIWPAVLPSQSAEGPLIINLT